MYANFGRKAPNTQKKQPPPDKPCCAACRRGIPGYGVLPCGRLGDCKCHLPAAEPARVLLAKRDQMHQEGTS